MIIRLLLGLLALAGIIWFLRWFMRTPVETVTRHLRRSGMVLGAALLLYLVASGRLHWLFALLGSLLPFARRLLGLLQFIPLLRRMTGRGAAGQQSRLETQLLRITLDHGTGRMNGEVLAGSFAGRRLENMTQSELSTLLEECRKADEESAILLQTYLDRMHSGAWRPGDSGRDSEYTGSGQSVRRKTMDRREALEILGLPDDADDQTIIATHRRLIQKLHPDRGGSNYLASMLNQAKDVLLGG